MSKNPKIPEKWWSLFVGFVFSTPGIAVCTAVGSALMLLLTRFTTVLEPYAPFSYGIVALVSALLVLGILLVSVILRDRFITKRPTYVEIDVANNTLGLLRFSNIQDLRSFVFGDWVVYLFIFDRSIKPAPVIHIEGIRNDIPKIEKQYVTPKAACVFLTSVGPEKAFRLTFNKDFDA